MRYSARFNRQAFNYVGMGNTAGTGQVASDASLTDENTDRTESSTELRLQDRIPLGTATSVWAGLRHTRLERNSVRTDGSRATAYTQSVNTPWLGISHDVMPGLMVYANSGQGIESEVAPNRSPLPQCAGMPLPALKSRPVGTGHQTAAGCRGLEPGRL